MLHFEAISGLRMNLIEQGKDEHVRVMACLIPAAFFFSMEYC